MSIKQPRQSVKLTAPQTAFLDAEAQALGITVAELIRRIIDAWRHGHGAEVNAVHRYVKDHFGPSEPSQ